jgi:ubiquinone/menaquinone biosynthesis C-methylase UbiE
MSELSTSFYDRWASLYDGVATASGVASWRERTTDSLALSPGDTVVEMGCGTGANFPALRERVGPEGRVVGVDLVPGMLGEAHRRIERNDWDNVSVLRGDATQPPVDRADAAVATFLTGMLPDPAAAVREWIRIVEPGGRLALLNATRTDRPFARPLNLGFRLFVRAGAPGARLSTESAVERLEARWRDASEALLEGTVDHDEERLGLGFVRLVSGRVPE